MTVLQLCIGTPIMSGPEAAAPLAAQPTAAGDYVGIW